MSVRLLFSSGFISRHFWLTMMMLRFVHQDESGWMNKWYRLNISRISNAPTMQKPVNKTIRNVWRAERLFSCCSKCMAWYKACYLYFFEKLAFMTIANTEIEPNWNTSLASRWAGRVISSSNICLADFIFSHLFTCGIIYVAKQTALPLFPHNWQSQLNFTKRCLNIKSYYLFYYYYYFWSL